MTRLFVSYKRQDKGKVFPIVEEIKQRTGIDCWIDLEGIESGDQFQNVIIDAIDQADIVVFMLSKNFIAIAPYRDEQTGCWRPRGMTLVHSMNIREATWSAQWPGMGATVESYRIRWGQNRPTPWGCMT